VTETGSTISVLIAGETETECGQILDSLSNQPDLLIIGLEKDEAGVLLKSARMKPDVLVINMHRPGIEVPELAPIIHRRSPATAIVVICEKPCEKDEDDYTRRALKAGVSGVLLRKTDIDLLAPVVKIVYSGGCFISASITKRLFGTISFLTNFPGQAMDFSKPWLDLKINYRFFSPAERRIITNIALGLSDREIAENLHFSPGTIRNYLAAIKRRTKLKNRTQIVIYSLVHGLINIDQIIDNSTVIP